MRSVSSVSVNCDVLLYKVDLYLIGSYHMTGTGSYLLIIYHYKPCFAITEQLNEEICCLLSVVKIISLDLTRGCSDVIVSCYHGLFMSCNLHLFRHTLECSVWV